jgi:hypothetical protein
MRLALRADSGQRSDTSAHRRGSRHVLLVAGLAVVASVMAVVIAKQLFPLFTRNPDEVAYVVQSRLVEQGKLTLPAQTQGQFFRPALSGPRGDKVLFVYTPEWAGVIAASHLVFGTTLGAVALTAAATVVVVYLFSRELYDRRVALAAAALFSLSPLFIVQSGTRLSYAFGGVISVLFGWLLLRALRIGSRLSFTLAGTAFSAALVGRPYDAILFGIPFAVLIIATHRRKPEVLLRDAGLLLAGAAPLLILAGAINQHLMGSPLSFPQNVAGRLNSFGFGARGGFQAPHARPVHYGIVEALSALGRNLLESRLWIFGGVMALVVAALGFFAAKRHEREWLLVGLLAVFPLGYIFYYAMYTATYTFHGINTGGPYYYYPAFPALAILVARGLILISDRGYRVITISVLAVMTALTGIAMRTPIHDATRNTRQQRQDLKAFSSVPSRNAIVLLHQFWLGGPHPTFTNDPELTNPVLYALDNGDKNIELLDRYRDRRAFLEAFDFKYDANIFTRTPDRVLSELTVRQTASFSRVLHVRDRSNKPYVIAYAQQGTHLVQRVVSQPLQRRSDYDTQWTVIAPSSATTAGDRIERFPLQPAEHGHFTLGVAFNTTSSLQGAERYEYRYAFSSRPDGSIEVVTPPQPWVQLVFPNGRSAWVPEDISPVITERG